MIYTQLLASTICLLTLVLVKAGRFVLRTDQVARIAPAVDSSRSVDTGVMAATVLNCTLVNVLAFKCVAVQSPPLLARTFKGAGEICARTSNAGR